jgi:hypothetical protein
MRRVVKEIGFDSQYFITNDRRRNAHFVSGEINVYASTANFTA